MPNTCFLLTASYRDHAGRLELTLHAVTESGTPVHITVDNFKPPFFVPADTPATATKRAARRRSLPLKTINGGTACGGIAVDCLYFHTISALQATARELRSSGITIYESDLSPLDRFLMERFVTGGFIATGLFTEHHGILTSRNPVIKGTTEITPRLKTLSLDIETNAHTGEILSIACCGKRDRVFIRGDGSAEEPVVFVPDERTLLRAFFDHIKAEDPDILTGWNVVDFDLSTIQARSAELRIPFEIGRGGATGARIVDGRNGKIARIPGRAVLDVPVQLRANFHSFEEYSLDFVAHAMLGRGKSIQVTGERKIDEIIRQFDEDPLSLARYNLLDAQLTREIFDKAGILQNAIERSKRSGHLLDRTGGSVAAFDFLYLPRLHRAGYVAQDVIGVSPAAAALPGGHVLEPTPGFYENVLVLDFRSLYPSIIMTFCIDPLGMAAQSSDRVRGPVGPSFARDAAILPGIISELLEGRARARREKNPYLAQAIKILMNSFYGVLGAQGCRFFSPEIAATITQTGQYILKETILHIEESTGCPVIYGDTDSLFVLLGPGTEVRAAQRGKEIADETTSWLAATLKERFSVDSAMELQFERHFRRFFMPALRGSTQGSKKHYCGLEETPSGPSLTFKGMEAARSDWTELARDFQHELLRRAFMNQPLEAYIIDTVERIRAGRVDEKLIYRKRLRKALGEYAGSIPPHVQAARLMKNPGHVIRYFITTAGPQPVENHTDPLDYEHYIDCQIKPIADAVLERLNMGFDRIVSGQQELF